MKNSIAIIYHSGTGHTKKVAEVIAEGAKPQASIVKIFTAEEAIANIDDLDNYNALVFGAPTYMGSVSAKFKEFMDASSKKWLTQSWKNKIAAGFTNAGSLSGDKLNTLITLSIFATQHGMIWVGQAEKPASSNGHGGKPDQINRMGSSLGLMTQSDNASPANTPSSGDIQTARLFGKRIADITAKFISTK